MSKQGLLYLERINMYIFVAYSAMISACAWNIEKQIKF